MIAARLDLQPADALAYHRSKGAVISWDHTEVWREDNVHSFTVAKATSLELLRWFHEEVDRAIGKGQTFQEFRRRLEWRLKDAGWWGKKEVLDIDTGEITQAQLGSVRRLRTIYQTNVQTAYMAGRYKRYVENAQARPYWRYIAIMDGRTRPAHAALHGKVFRWDDPIWEVIWPPNGWGCRCRVQALSEAEFSALGIELSNGRDSIVSLDVPINRDGDMATVQGLRYTDSAGKPAIFRPDPGWDYNPGAEWARWDPAGFKSDAADAPSITAQSTGDVVKARDDQPTWKDLGRPDLRDKGITRRPAPEMLMTAEGLDAAVEAMNQAMIPDGKMNVVKTPVEEVAIRPELLPHMVEKRADGRERYALYAMDTLKNPFEVWLTAYDDGSYRKRYIGVFQGAEGDKERNLLVILRENTDGSIMWDLYNMMQQDSKRLNRLRVGKLLYWLGMEEE